jgi:propionyl-CoA carboxylase alpha chain
VPGHQDRTPDGHQDGGCLFRCRSDALHVEMADEAVHIGPAAAAESYLVADKIIAACKETGAEAVHPGYGFLSERASFAKRSQRRGSAGSARTRAPSKAMGDKIESKKFANEAGVSTVPGYLGLIEDTATKPSRSPRTSAIRS